MVRRGHQIHVVARTFAQPVEKLATATHVIENATTRIAFAEAAMRALQDLSLDVIHDTGAGWYCDVFQPHFGSRDAVFEQNLLFLPRALRPWKRAVSRYLPRYREFSTLASRQYTGDGRLFLALSQRIAEDFVKTHGVSRESIRLIYNGVDCRRFSPSGRDARGAEIRRRLGVNRRTVLVLAIAHNYRLKGIPTTLRAMRRLAGQPFHLAVIGGKRPAKYEHMARRWGIGPQVTFVGSIANPVPYYAAADVLVHPTFYDTCSLVVLEALASGLPVVTSRMSGIDELLSDGEDALLLDDPGDAEGLARLLGDLSDRQRRERVAAAARRFALAHPFQQNCDQIETVYHEVVERRRQERVRAA